MDTGDAKHRSVLWCAVVPPIVQQLEEFYLKKAKLIEKANKASEEGSKLRPFVSMDFGVEPSKAVMMQYRWDGAQWVCEEVKP